MSKEGIGKLATSVITGLVASFWGIYGPVILCVLIAICMNVVSGLVSAMASGEKLSSKVGWIGFWKKMALILALAVITEVAFGAEITDYISLGRR